MDSLLDEEVETAARSLVEQGYFQTSGKFRHLARLPEGKTAYEALNEVAPHVAERFKESFERWCRSQYLRVYVRGEPDQVTVSPEVLKAFRRLGGQVA